MARRADVAGSPGASGASRAEAERIAGRPDVPPARRSAQIQGIVHAMFQRPTAGGSVELVARVSGREGTIELVWLGRRSLAGMQQGTEIRARGMLTTVRGRPTIFNPSYELVPLSALPTTRS